jgi:hypothetical protein
VGGDLEMTADPQERQFRRHSSRRRLCMALPMQTRRLADTELACVKDEKQKPLMLRLGLSVRANHDRPLKQHPHDCFHCAPQLLTGDRNGDERNTRIEAVRRRFGAGLRPLGSGVSELATSRCAATCGSRLALGFARASDSTSWLVVSGARPGGGAGNGAGSRSGGPAPGSRIRQALAGRRPTRLRPSR